MATDSEPKQLKLYSYWRSSCSCRVRIALNLKGLKYEYVALNLLKGEHKSPDFLKLNPLGLVPVLIDGDTVISDSLAILLYLEEKYPQRPLLPQDLHLKTLNYQAANIVYASIQPYQNLPIIGYIKEKLGADEMVSWVQHRIKHGFAALEKLFEKHAGKYATGDEVLLADLYLAPQIDGAITRFDVDMNEFPSLSKINEAKNSLLFKMLCLGGSLIRHLRRGTESHQIQIGQAAYLCNQEKLHMTGHLKK